MKKVLAVFMAALVAFSTLSIAVFAAEPEAATVAEETEQTETEKPVVETTTVTVEEKTTRNIKNEDGLVVPINLRQLKDSVIFKIFEKIFKFILSLFGAEGPEIDKEGATIVDEIGSALDERLSHIFG